MDLRLIEIELKKCFPEQDIIWRVQQSGLKNDKPWASVLAYIDNRAIMDRLDEVVGPGNWQNAFKEVKDGFICGIGIWCQVQQFEDWVWKWDGAQITNIEAVKGGLSDAMKRAGYQWGIGRYLYNLPAGWAEFSDKGEYSAKIENKWFKWNPPKLPEWALPPKETDFKAFLTEIKKLKDTLNLENQSIGPAIYYRLLASLPGKPSHANEIKNPSVQRQFYTLLKGIVGLTKNEPT